MGKTSPQPKQSAIRLPCACSNLRRAARLVSQLYDEELRPVGIRVPQFSLLQALTQAPGISQKQLAEILGMDSTTLTRTLALLRKHGWLSSRQGRDRRELRLALTTAGTREYKRALPYWESAQKRLKQALGETSWNKMIDTAVDTAEAIPRG